MIKVRENIIYPSLLDFLRKKLNENDFYISEYGDINLLFRKTGIFSIKYWSNDKIGTLSESLNDITITIYSGNVCPTEISFYADLWSVKTGRRVDIIVNIKRDID